jgi:DNA-binding transcriptional regulator YiaG
MASSSPMTTHDSSLRGIRQRLQLSQVACAAAIGIAPETFRRWEAGRRPVPACILLRAQALTTKRSSPERLPLQVLANHFQVHVRTLRAAAHDGRLAATFGARPYFGRLTATATREDVATFMATWYRRTYGRGRRCLVPVCRVKVPESYSATVIGLRRRLGLSQQELAVKVDAAGKAVVYQWESGKRKPSPVFWLRVQQLQRRQNLNGRSR